MTDETIQLAEMGRTGRSCIGTDALNWLKGAKKEGNGKFIEKYSGKKDSRVYMKGGDLL